MFLMVLDAFFLFLCEAELSAEGQLTRNLMMLKLFEAF